MDRFNASVVTSFLDSKTKPLGSWSRTLLHVGCGFRCISDLKGFDQGEWSEIRLDINEEVEPDIIGTLTDLSGVQSSSIDVVYSSHSIEHIFSHEVPLALKEFKRVLKSDGFAVVFCPDMAFVCKKAAEGGLTEILYHSPAGPITPLDMIYGHGRGIMDGNPYMAHKTGFTLKTLDIELRNVGFACTVGTNPQPWNIGAIAFKSTATAHRIELISAQFL